MKTEEMKLIYCIGCGGSGSVKEQVVLKGNFNNEVLLDTKKCLMCKGKGYIWG